MADRGEARSQGGVAQRKAAVRARLSIGAVVGGHVKLSGSAGSRNRRGKCPFHGSNSPSFALFDAHSGDGGAHCFGCAWHGDIFDFVADIRGVGFMDALAELEGLAGLGRAAVAQGLGPVQRARNPAQHKLSEYVEPIEQGRWIWRHAVRDDTAVARYFAGRGVPGAVLTPDRLAAFRYLVECPCTGWREGEDPRKVIHAPAIMALMVRAERSDAGEVSFVPQGLHVTYLSPGGDGTMKRRKPWAKADDPDPWLPKRRMLGPAGSAAVVLLGDFARTSGERRDVQLRLLDLDAREKRAKLEQILALEELGKASKAEADAARERLALLDRNYALRRDSTLRGTAGPGENLLRELNQSPAELSERIDQIKVDAIENLSAGLVDAIVNFRSLGDVAVSTLQVIQRGLLEIAVEKYVAEPLAKLVFGAEAGALSGEGMEGSAKSLGESGVVLSTAGATLITAATAWQTTAAAITASAIALANSQGGGGSTGGSILGSILGIAVGAFGGGGPSASLVKDVGATLDANPGLFASGTDRIPTGRWFDVGENGRERMRLHEGGRLEVMGSARTRRMSDEGSFAPVLNVTVNVPSRADPRRTARTVALATQGAIAKANRQGIARGIIRD